ncbi:hypothetical protein [Escherichia phage CLB_P2]|uniref:Uncharacterized protein n=2 Tax=Caudoviricetes TaxID=2731619 RepID=A0A2S1GPC9_9CAUD|nr:hypothetical protein KNT84_gp213 [Enterobacteria phage vB_EcoM_IME281]QAY00095.1 hypothetical protein EcWhh1_164 [Escherichia phage EcWhh-1]QHR70737.1 hypothetical protein dhaeg_193 [Escherichia phage dhaeg]UNI73109.1 hypothetical protein [Escherichia phage CLB_P2]CAH1615735.1 hypothetical protein UGJNECP3_00183 [Escherichia phage UGJNEcP3]CAH1616673.1 hypothetical protein UGJNECP4_00074 [Escherichia phage UGJNEcP4]CAI9865975.1 hypothetical protein PFGHJN_00217 [Escherichia phage UP19]
MSNLPEDVSVIIVLKALAGFQRTPMMNNSETIIKAANMLSGSHRDFRIFPISSKTTYMKMPDPKIAWDEGMTLNEFEDYLND